MSGDLGKLADELRAIRDRLYDLTDDLERGRPWPAEEAPDRLATRIDAVASELLELDLEP